MMPFVHNLDSRRATTVAFVGFIILHKLVPLSDPLVVSWFN